MSEAIEATKDMIYKQVDANKTFMFGVAFSLYQRVYAATNENIAGYTSSFDFQNKEKVLSVLGSGDHPFNAIYYGIKQVDTFDTNALTEYFALGIKRAAILTYDYEEYLKFRKKIISADTTIFELNEIVISLFKNMEEKYRNYWREILDYNYQIQKGRNTNLNLFQMLLLNLDAFLHTTITNNYLQDEAAYLKLKDNLKKATISFKVSDCLLLKQYFKKEYDFIFLSNIVDYFYRSYGFNWNYAYFQNDKNNLLSLLNHDGILAINYINQYYSNVSKSYKSKLIDGSTTKKKDLTTEEIIKFSHIVNNKVSKATKDGLILERKR